MCVCATECQIVHASIVAVKIVCVLYCVYFALRSARSMILNVSVKIGCSQLVLLLLIVWAENKQLKLSAVSVCFRCECAVWLNLMKWIHMLQIISSFSYQIRNYSILYLSILIKLILSNLFSVEWTCFILCVVFPFSFIGNSRSYIWFHLF